MTSLLLLKSMLLANILQKSKKKKKMKLKNVDTKTKSLDPQICRTCNDGRGNVPIFNNLLQPNISEEIKHFTGITVTPSDNLPKYMCQNCVDLLNGCIMFRDVCQRTNKELIELSIKTEQKSYEDFSSHQIDNSDDESYNIPSPSFSDDDREFWLKPYEDYTSECQKEESDPKASKEPRKQRYRIFLCDICGKVAKSNANLLVHKSIHENVFPFQCDQCPYQGRTMDLLKVHKRSHLADKPYKCSQCPKATTTSSNLKKHMRHVHSDSRPYKCTYCEKAFTYVHDKNRHIRDIHLRQGTVECDVCYKKFNTKKILQGHRWKIHKIKSDRLGRLPAYLQYQAVKNDNDINCDLNY